MTSVISAAPGRRSTRSVDEDVVVAGGDPRKNETDTRERMVQIVRLLSEMDEHILGLYDPAVVARYVLGPKLLLPMGCVKLGN